MRGFHHFFLLAFLLTAESTFAFPFKVSNPIDMNAKDTEIIEDVSGKHYITYKKSGECIKQEIDIIRFDCEGQFITFTIGWVDPRLYQANILPYR
ncbi:hypothetical protein [Sansalvadorimonas verongulae]|uniref:hypothetical protein n=1 Tax=Sansalvadorimonas verongulae TaxID=2172824 RepID=UPI0012BD2A84|nr:hypothetical protein [Sansalvadorimonas verongulae]MTI13264.1 hypothetical protein [Sansalvadorimonas verongulae]